MYTSLKFSERAEGLLTALESSLEHALDASGQLQEILWHYTSVEGLRAIVSANTLRFSHARFLNDSSEIALGWSRVTDALSAAISSATNLKQFFEMTNAVTDEVYHATHYFIFCFSTRPDSLSQWRAYADTGSGYALGFDSQKVRSVTEPDVNAALLRMVYRRAEQDALIDAGIAAARKFWSELLKGSVASDEKEGILGRANVRLSHFMMRAALSFKDESFEDEQEWRLVVGLHPAEPKDQGLLGAVNFRSGGGIVKPYLDLPARREHDSRLPITTITFGPTLRPVLTRESLQFFLRQRGYSGVPVDQSQVPLQA